MIIQQLATVFIENIITFLRYWLIKIDVLQDIYYIKFNYLWFLLDYYQNI